MGNNELIVTTENLQIGKRYTPVDINEKNMDTEPVTILTVEDCETHYKVSCCYGKKLINNTVPQTLYMTKKNKWRAEPD